LDVLTTAVPLSELSADKVTTAAELRGSYKVVTTAGLRLQDGADPAAPEPTGSAPESERPVDDTAFQPTAEDRDPAPVDAAATTPDPGAKPDETAANPFDAQQLAEALDPDAATKADTKAGPTVDTNADTCEGDDAALALA